jgi:hypothetical protein
MNDCRCSLHPRKPHVDPCRACSSKHVQPSRAAADRSNASALVTFEDNQPQREGLDPSAEPVLIAKRRVGTALSRSRVTPSGAFTKGA